MPRLDPEEHKRRKEATKLRCLDEDGKPLNEASKSRAGQSARDKCDINRIVKRAIRPDGKVDMAFVQSLSKTPGRYGDFTGATDFQESLNRVVKMNTEFMRLAPEIRKKFNNDPAELIAYLDQAQKDPKVKEEAISLGILPKPVIKTTRLESPEGNFWVTTKDGVEISRNEIKKPKTEDPAPGS